MPRIPFAPEFRPFADAGARLARIHVHYEEQPEHPLTQIETPDMPLKLARSKKCASPKTRHSSATTTSSPSTASPPKPSTTASATAPPSNGVIDQYRVKTDKRSGILNDPNRPHDPQYIRRLIAQVIAVSLETDRIVGNLPDLAVDIQPSPSAAA